MMFDVLTRRSFVSALAAAGAARLLPALAAEDGAQPAVDGSALKVTRYTVAVGAAKPFTALHISDTHLSFVDRVDGKPSPRNAEARRKCFPGAEAGLKAAFAYAREHDALLIHTGDLIDYINDGNLAAAAAWKAASRGGLIAAGNHEYCQMVGDGKVEDEAYKAASRARVQAVYPDNLLFASRIVNGVNFVLFDNIYYYVPAGVPEMFEAEAAKGLPMVLCCHVPFYTESLYQAVTRGHADRPPYLCGVPDAIIAGVKDAYRRKQQRADARTKAFVARLTAEPLVKAILCGHLHWAHVSEFAPGVKLYCVGANFKAEAFELTFC